MTNAEKEVLRTAMELWKAKQRPLGSSYGEFLTLERLHDAACSALEMEQKR